jgi:hypothetical protein
MSENIMLLTIVKPRTQAVDAVVMAGRSWLVAWTLTVAGAILLGWLVHPVVGSGRACEGIGFGCTPERDMDTFLVVAVYFLAAAVTLVVAWWRSRAGRSWRPALAAGIAITVLATALVVWSQLPRYSTSPGSLDAARKHWERVLADGRAVASPGTPLANALRALERRGPLTCRDAYGRSTGAHEFRWSSADGNAAFVSSSGSRSGSVTAAALGRWAERLRARGLGVVVTDPDGDPASDRRLQVGGSGPAAGDGLSVRASSYIWELEITATTGCHRG